MKQIKINGKDYNYKYNLRSLFVFEKIVGHTFEIRESVDAYAFYFAMLAANNEDFTLTWDEFIDACDEDEGIALTMGEYLTDYFKKTDEITKHDKTKKASKKK